MFKRKKETSKHIQKKNYYKKKMDHIIKMNCWTTILQEMT